MNITSWPTYRGTAVSVVCHAPFPGQATHQGRNNSATAVAVVCHAAAGAGCLV